MTPTVRILISYAYGRAIDFQDEVDYAEQRGTRLQIMADSGAFTVYTLGKTISLRDYATWLTTWAPLFSCAAPLDVIGDHKATANNVDRLRDLVGDVVNVLGAFHINSPLSALERQCATSTYVGVGAGVGLMARRKAMTRYLVDVHKIAREHGVSLHGFGMTVPSMVTSLPWTSVDSSYWNSAARTGTLRLYDRTRHTWEVIRVSHGKPVPPRIAKLIREYGGDPAVVRAPGFALVSEHGERGVEERRWMIDTTIASWLGFAESWRASTTPTIQPPLVKEPGPSLYLACGGSREIRRVIDVATGARR